MDKKEVINSQTLKEETEKEFGTKLIESNAGSTRYSSRDRSYSNLIEFFIKVAKRDPDQGETDWGRLSAKEKAVAVIKAICLLLVTIGFVIIVAHFGGRLGLIVALFFVFVVWMIIYQIRKKRGSEVEKDNER